jgi:hypothetical protein
VISILPALIEYLRARFIAKCPSVDAEPSSLGEESAAG